MTDHPATRRRGAELEDAILAAAWEELANSGYSHFTFEAVAKRAETSRPVLYRRWPTRAGLACAAIVRHIRRNPLNVPDLGDLREEVCLLMRRFADRSPPPQLRLIIEMSEDMAAENTSFMDARFQDAPMQQIIERAIARGEVAREKVTARVLRVPLSLALHEAVVSGRQISDQAISEIVDQIFLPLVVSG